MEMVLAAARVAAFIPSTALVKAVVPPIALESPRARDVALVEPMLDEIDWVAALIFTAMLVMVLVGAICRLYAIIRVIKLPGDMAEEIARIATLAQIGRAHV